MKKIVLKFGLIAGLAISLFMAVSMLNMNADTDMSNSEIIGYAAQVLCLSVIFIAVKQYRDQHLNGTISFKTAFKIGFFISLITATLYVITWMILSEFFLQDFMELYMQKAIEDVKSNPDLSPMQIEEQLNSMQQMMEMYENRLFKFAITYIEILPSGLLISLIAALIFKRRTLN